MTSLRSSSRRTILAAGLAGIAASIVDALGRPRSGRAADGGNVLLGTANTATNITSITNTTDTDTVFLASNSAGGIGVQGSSNSSFGVIGTSSTNHGARGESAATNKAGVFGWNSGGSTGVAGVSAASGALTAPAKTGVYGFANQDSTAIGVSGESGSGTGVYGESSSGRGVFGFSSSHNGVVGYAGDYPDALPSGVGVIGFAGGAAGGPGVAGYAGGTGATGVLGTGAYGVRGIGTWGGVSGQTDTEESTAVYGGANSPTGETYGVAGHSLSPAGIGIMGWHVGNGTALAAHSGDTDTTVTPQLNTAILGIASQTTTSARGVVGRTTAGYGVHGQVTTGRGVYGSATTGQGIRGYSATGAAGYFSTSGLKKGSAIRAVGRVRLDNCAGIATVVSGQTSVTVTPGIDIGPTSAVVATVMSNSSTTLAIRRVSTDTAADTFTIHISGTAPAAGLKVAWHCFG